MAKALVNHLSEEQQEAEGLIAYCRVDFPADAMWKQLRFVPVYERPGRSKTGSTLRVWVRKHNHPTLFSSVRSEVAWAVLDTCVVLDLQDPVSAKSRESKALLGDWLADDVELVVTDELLHEICRNPDAAQRKRRQEFSSAFERVVHDPGQFDVARADLSEFFPKMRSENQESDLRQLSMAIAAQAQFFVTRDEHLLGIQDEVARRWGLIILRPSELVGQSYEERRESLYRPVRLAGTAINESRARVAEFDSITRTFLECGAGESKSQFARTMRDAASEPDMQRVLVFRDPDEKLLAIMVLDFGLDEVVRVPVLRVARTRIADLVAQHILWRAVLETLKNDRTVTLLEDKYYPKSLSIALDELGFHAIDRGWAKVSLKGISTSKNLSDRLSNLSVPGVELPFLDEWSTIAASQDRIPVKLQMDFELAIWPGKLSNSSLPSFVIPIRPYWASQLFEERIASSDLFGAPPTLMLRTQNVYYRSARPLVLNTPGRALWYVSEEKDVPDSKQLAGCSYVREVVVGPASELCSRFERLGVYRWKDVLTIAKNEPNAEVMAFRFSHTELFPTPIPYAVFAEVVEHRFGTQLMVRTPWRLPSGCFETLYELGFGRL